MKQAVPPLLLVAVISHLLAKASARHALIRHADRSERVSGNDNFAPRVSNISVRKLAGSAADPQLPTAPGVAAAPGNVTTPPVAPAPAPVATNPAPVPPTIAPAPVQGNGPALALATTPAPALQPGPSAGAPAAQPPADSTVSSAGNVNIATGSGDEEAIYAAEEKFGGTVYYVVVCCFAAALYYHLKTPPASDTGPDSGRFKSGNWRFGLFTCMQEPGLTCFTCFFPGVRWADNVRMAHFSTFGQGFMIAILCFLLCQYMSVLLPRWYWATYLFCVGLLVHFRQRMRQLFMLPHSDTRSVCIDCASYGCCPLCSIVQEARQVEEAYQCDHPAVMYPAVQYTSLRAFEEADLHHQARPTLKWFNVVMMSLLIWWQWSLLDQFSDDWPTAAWTADAVHSTSVCQLLFDQLEVALVASAIIWLADLVFAISFAAGGERHNKKPSMRVVEFVEHLVYFSRMLLGMWGFVVISKTDETHCESCTQLYSSSWWMFFVLQAFGLTLVLFATCFTPPQEIVFEPLIFSPRGVSPRTNATAGTRESLGPASRQPSYAPPQVRCGGVLQSRVIDPCASARSAFTPRGHHAQAA